jgi:cephalosporin hydroxylase
LGNYHTPCQNIGHVISIGSNENLDTNNVMPIETDLNSPIKDLLEAFHWRSTFHTTWCGIRTQKNPLDFWVYQEIIWETKPNTVIEIGNLFGGSALALAHLLDMVGHGRVIAVDVHQENMIDPLARAHPRITWIEGDATLVFDQVSALIGADERVMIVEDSAHDFITTTQILDLYSPLVKVGDYFIVEDGICHHGVPHGPMPGPYESIKNWLRKNPNWISDRERENWLLTHNPRGYLKRVA